MKRHIKGVHEKIKDAICEVCGFMASRNDGLRQHREFCPTNDESKRRKRQEASNSKSDENFASGIERKFANNDNTEKSL